MNQGGNLAPPSPPARRANFSHQISQEASDSVPLSVTWPLDTAVYANSTLDKHVISKRSVAKSLHYSVKVILAGEQLFMEDALAMV